MEIKATATKLTNAKGSIKGLATLSFGKNIRIRSISIMQSKEGKLFVSMPCRKSGKEGNEKYTEVCHPITKEFRDQMNEAILKSYEKGEAVSFEDGKEGALALRVNAFQEPYGTRVGEAKLFINDSFVVNSVSIFETKSGNIYPAMPSYKSNKTDDKGKAVYEEICSTGSEFKKVLNKSIINKFNEKKKEMETSKITIKDKIADGKEKSNSQKTADKSSKEKETAL